MKKYNIVVFFALFCFSISSYAENEKKFTDATGQEVSCSIDNGMTHCKNNQGETLICSNSDSGYICSSEDE